MNDDTSPNSKKRLHDIQREEKQFLMQAWCGQLLPPFEDGEPLSELAKRALLTARPYVEVSMANRIDALLEHNESESGVVLAQEDDAPFGEEDLFSEGDTSDDLFGTEDEYSSTASSRSSLSQRSHEPLESRPHRPEDPISEETPGFTPSVGHHREETPGFVPTKGERKESAVGKRKTDEQDSNDREETAGFVPTKGKRKESAIGKRKTDEQDSNEGEETAGFVPTKGERKKSAVGKRKTDEQDSNEGEETAGFVPTKGERKESTVGKRKTDEQDSNDRESPDKTDDPWPVEEDEYGSEEDGDSLFPVEDETDQKGENSKEETTATDRPEETRRNSPSAADRSTNLEERKRRIEERKKRARERFSQRKQGRIDRQDEPTAKDESEEQTAAGPSAEDRLNSLTHLITLDHLENNLGLQIIPEDRLGIERQLAKKLRDPAVGSLLDQAEEQGLSLVMVPRIQRAILDGKLLKITSANLLRMYPQFFEDVQQVALKMRAEAYFLQETPQMGWGLTTAEILTASHNTNYIQQKQVLKQHAQSHKSNEMRVRRRTLIEALFDLLAVKVVTGEKLLNNTADLTESKVGRANMAVINYGESGIRISDINRQQAHPQLGVCPTW